MQDYTNFSITKLAAFISDHLKTMGFDIVLVGGLAVELFSKNIYLTQDIDFVITKSPNLKIDQAMIEIGFRRKGRVFTNQSTPIFVEFPPGPLAVGNSIIRKTTQIRVDNSALKTLFPIDIMKDRLAAFIHWQDRESLIQAIAISLFQDVNIKDLEKFCQKEGQLGTYELFVKIRSLALLDKPKNMNEIAKIAMQFLIQES